MQAKNHKRSLTNSPQFYIDLQQSIRSPSIKSPKSSYNHHARHLSQNVTWVPLGTDTGRVNTEPTQMITNEWKSSEDPDLSKMSVQMKQFTQFLKQNMNHLSERSLKHFNFDTIDHLTYFTQSSRSTNYTDDQRALLLSIGKNINEPKTSDKKNSSQITLGSPRRPLPSPKVQSNVTNNVPERKPKSHTIAHGPQNEKLKQLKALGKSIGGIFDGSSPSVKIGDPIHGSNKEKKTHKKNTSSKSATKRKNVLENTTETVYNIMPYKNKQENKNFEDLVNFEKTNDMVNLSPVISLHNRENPSFYNLTNVGENNFEHKEMPFIRRQENNKINMLDINEEEKTIKEENDVKEEEKMNSHRKRNKGFRELQSTLGGIEEFTKLNELSDNDNNRKKEHESEKPNSIVIESRKSNMSMPNHLNEGSCTILVSEPLTVANKDEIVVKKTKSKRFLKSKLSIKNLLIDNYKPVNKEYTKLVFNSTNTPTKKSQNSVNISSPFEDFNDGSSHRFDRERIKSLPDEVLNFEINSRRRISHIKEITNYIPYQTDLDDKRERSRERTSGFYENTEETEENKINNDKKQEMKNCMLRFDFKKKRKFLPQLKKSDSFRKNSGMYGYKTQNEASQHDFVFGFDQTIKGVNKILHGSSLSMQKAVHKFSEQTEMSQLEDFFRKDFGEERLLKGITEIGKLTKTNSFDSEFTPSLLRLQTQIPTDTQPEQVTVTHEKEIVSRPNHIIKPFPLKNSVITVNINPPIEEASPHMEESMLPYPSLANQNDAFEIISETKLERQIPTDEVQINTSNVIMASMTTVSRGKQYKFELTSRKQLEESLEDDKPFEDPGLIENNTDEDGSFRERIEDFFTYEGGSQNKLESYGRKLLMERMKDSFFKFVEKILLNPTDIKKHVCVFETYEIDDIKKPPFVNSNELLEFYLKVSETVSQILEAPTLIDEQFYLRSRNEENSLNENVFLDDEKQESMKRIENIGNPFSFEKIMSRIAKLPSCPLLIFINFKSIQKLRDTYSSMKNYLLSTESKGGIDAFVDHKKINCIFKSLNELNWRFIKRAIISHYEKAFRGFFEHKIAIKNQVKINFPKESTLEKVKLLREKAQRRMTIRKSSDITKSQDALARKTGEQGMKTLTKSVFAAVAISKTTTKLSATATVINEYDEKEEKEEKDAKNESSNPKMLSTKHERRSRRQSKSVAQLFTPPIENITIEKPSNIEKTNTAQTDPQSLPKTTSISITTSEPQPEAVPDTFILLNGKTITASEDDTTDATHKLQIPNKSFMGNQVKLQSLLGTKDGVKEKPLSARKAQKNFYNAANTLGSSLFKSIPPSDNQVTKSAQLTPTSRQAKVQIDDSNSPTREIKLDLEPKLQKGRSKNLKEVATLFLKPSVAQTIKTILSKSPTAKSPLSGGHKKEAVQSKLEKNGPKSAFFFAIYNRKQQELQEMLELYPREVVNIRDDEGNTPLLVACKMGDWGIVSLLLHKKIDINAQNNEGNTALHLALQYRHDNIADLLIQHGIKQTFKNKKGRTAWEMLEP